MIFAQINLEMDSDFFWFIEFLFLKNWKFEIEKWNEARVKFLLQIKSADKVSISFGEYPLY